MGQKRKPRELEEKAQQILAGNVLSKRAAVGKEDVGWVRASWAHPEGAGILDPVATFEVGVAVAMNRRPYEECERAARFLSFKDPLPEGLDMLPDSEGNHLNVPMLGILLKANLVEVRRGGKMIGSASIWHSLIGFEEKQRAQLSRPTQEEEREQAGIRREEAEIKKKEEARARKAKEALDAEEALEDCFLRVWGDWEKEEEEREQAEKAARWEEFLSGAAELQEVWKKAKASSNEMYEQDKPVVEALQLVLRPTPPRKGDLLRVLPQVRGYLSSLGAEHAKFRWGKLMGWVKDVSARSHLSLPKSLGKAHSDMPWLLPKWFVVEGDSASPLYPLKELTAYSRAEWVLRVGVDPVLDDKTKKTLLSLAGEGEDKELI